MEKIQTLILAHRGASGYYPENTMTAFRKAIEMGADGFELDVHLTKDGKMVVIHDEKVDRTSYHRGYVKDYTLAQLKDMNFNRKRNYRGKEHISTLEEVLDLLKPTDLTLNIELKTNVFEYPGIEEKVLAAVKERKMEDRIIYSSFNHDTIARVRKLDPQARVGFLFDENWPGSVEDFKRIGGEALHPDKSFVKQPEFMKAVEEVGADINTWTVNKEKTMEEFMKMNLHCIITNYPDKAVNIREQLNKTLAKN